MPTLREALVWKGLVSKAKARRIEDLKERELSREEQASAELVLSRTAHDLEEERRRQRFLAQASRETVRPGSNTGTKAYLKRFG